jgi:hypothetical protein
MKSRMILRLLSRRYNLNDAEAKELLAELSELYDSYKDYRIQADTPFLDFAKWLIQFIAEHPELIEFLIGLLGEEDVSTLESGEKKNL